MNSGVTWRRYPQLGSRLGTQLQLLPPDYTARVRVRARISVRSSGCQAEGRGGGDRVMGGDGASSMASSESNSTPYSCGIHQGRYPRTTTLYRCDPLGPGLREFTRVGIRAPGSGSGSGLGLGCCRGVTKSRAFCEWSLAIWLRRGYLWLCVSV